MGEMWGFKPLCSEHLYLSLEDRASGQRKAGVD